MFCLHSFLKLNNCFLSLSLSSRILLEAFKEVNCFFLLFLDISLVRFMSLLGILAIFQNPPGDGFANFLFCSR